MSGVSLEGCEESCSEFDALPGEQGECLHKTAGKSLKDTSSGIGSEGPQLS